MKKRANCGMTILLVLTSTLLVLVASNQDDTIADLQNRMDAVEDRVAALTDEVASLASILAETGGGDKQEQVDLEFRLVNLSETYDRETGTFNFTVEYQARQQPLILMAPNQWNPPAELKHEKGILHFSVPDTEISPLLYVHTPSLLTYTLVLVHASGPSRPTRPMVRAVMATTPPHSLPLPQDGPAELSVKSRVVGNRTVREEQFSFHAYLMEPHAVDVSTYQFSEDMLEASTAESGDVSARIDDVISNTDAGNNDVMDTPQLLELVRGRREGEERSYTFRVKARPREVGVLYVEHRFEFRCLGCVLYELRVSQPVVLYPAGEGYYVPEGALLPYRPSSDMDSTVSGPQYLAFTRYEASQDVQHVNRTCYEGHRCFLICEAFGDTPTAHFILFASPVGRQPVYFDQSGARLQDDSQGRAAVAGWSIQLGYMAFSVVRFQSVRIQDADTYVCVASLQSGRSLTQHIALTVLPQS